MARAFPGNLEEANRAGITPRIRVRTSECITCLGPVFRSNWTLCKPFHEVEKQIGGLMSYLLRPVFQYVQTGYWNNPPGVLGVLPLSRLRRGRFSIPEVNETTLVL